jgi:Tol biopolymer transport system component
VTTVRHRDGGSDLWMFDLSRGLGSRFTLGETSALDPVWSPDGRQIAYDDGAGGLYVKASNGASPPKKVLQDAGGVLEPKAWSPDGYRIVYEVQTASTSLDLWTVTMTGEPKPEKFLTTPASEELPALSRDGRWLTYLSNESGRAELYVLSFPDRAGKWQVSPEGARDGGWIGGGNEIWYRDLEGKFFAVTATPSGAGLVIGSRRPLFGGQVLPVAFGAFAPDGKRFLGAASAEGDAGAVLTLVTNWDSELEKP